MVGRSKKKQGWSEGSWEINKRKALLISGIVAFLIVVVGLFLLNPFGGDAIAGQAAEDGTEDDPAGVISLVDAGSKTIVTNTYDTNTITLETYNLLEADYNALVANYNSIVDVIDRDGGTYFSYDYADELGGSITLENGNTIYTNVYTNSHFYTQEEFDTSFIAGQNTFVANINTNGYYDEEYIMNNPGSFNLYTEDQLNTEETCVVGALEYDVNNDGSSDLGDVIAIVDHLGLTVE